MHRTLWPLLLAALIASSVAAGDKPGSVQHGLRLPPGFEVTEFADGGLANDIFSLTFDPRGRVVVSGRGYVRILADDNNDGRADRAIEVAAGPKDGALGMLWEGEWLYVTGDGGLRRYRDADGDGRADGPSELIRALKTGGEHDAHDIRRGPDGWLYVLCGNMTGVNKAFAQTPGSPITDPVAGCVIRFSPNLRTSEIVADGFRNAYRMDFNADGELFTFDSDNERCVSLPWYEPTRFYHVIPGGHYGWRSPQRCTFWRLPPYLPGVVPPVAYLGRGSPTGVACYRHTQFPEPYRGGVFLLDWTFGKVHFVPLRRAGASYAGTPQVFLESVGEDGFAPTDAAVHPATGDLYLAIGGRGTRGAVYRVRYPAGLKSGMADRPGPLPGRKLDWQPESADRLVERAVSSPPHERLRALAELRRHRMHFDSEKVSRVVRANWDHPDRLVRAAAADLIAALEGETRRALRKQATKPMQLATCWLSGTPEEDDLLDAAHRVLTDKDADAEVLLAGVRLAQLALGDLSATGSGGKVWEGYSPRRVGVAVPPRVLGSLRGLLSCTEPDLAREVTRTLAMLEDGSPESVEGVVRRLDDRSDPLADIHYLIVLARLRGPRSREATERTAAALLALDRKLVERRLTRDRHWPLRLGEGQAELARKDPALNAALLASSEFGRPDHALWTQCPGFDRPSAAERFLARAAADKGFAWNATLVDLVGSLPDGRGLPVLRRLWDEAGLDEPILAVLARQPHETDCDKFLEGLSRPDADTVRRCLDALKKLPPRRDGTTALALVRGLRRLHDGREVNQLREQLAAYLRQVTGQDRPGTDKEGWAAWFRTAYPDLAGRLGDADGVDMAAWGKRLATLDWSAGEAERGRAVFTRTTCAACHSGGQALGPDLRGVAGRFSRDDLFTAILRPNKDISPRYRTTALTTGDGKVYQGLIIYEATDGVLLQTGASTTVRLAGAQIAGRRETATSLMPAGLLDRLADRDIVDLYAYLKSLNAPSKDP